MTGDERYAIAAEAFRMFSALALDVTSAEIDGRDDDVRFLHKRIVAIERAWQARMAAREQGSETT